MVSLKFKLKPEREAGLTKRKVGLRGGQLAQSVKRKAQIKKKKKTSGIFRNHHKANLSETCMPQREWPTRRLEMDFFMPSL